MLGISSHLLQQVGFATGVTDSSVDVRGGKIAAFIPILAQNLRIPTTNIYWLNQVHSAKVVKIDSGNDDVSNIEADALITNTNDVVIGIKTGDCIPILLADPVTGAMAAIHAGRKGVELGIIKNVIQALQTNYAVHPANLRVFFGPSIGKKSHLVYLENAEFFGKQYFDPLPKGTHIMNNQALFTDYMLRTGLNESDLRHKISVFLDLEAYVYDVILSLGVGESHIESCGIDTFADKRFHSYRRDFPNHGLMLSYITKMTKSESKHE